MGIKKLVISSKEQPIREKELMSKDISTPIDAVLIHHKFPTSLPRLHPGIGAGGPVICCAWHERQLRAESD
jgi:hypothetical protein